MIKKKILSLQTKPRGQVLVIFAVSLLALLLAIDSGVAYVSYGQLKRAVDAASVAAANNFKRGASYEEMVAATIEVIKLHNVDTDPNKLNLKVFICDKDQNNITDPDLSTLKPEFFAICPDTSKEAARKLVWVEARQLTPFYFLSLLGFNGISLSTNATAEAAAVDLVLVIDTSESMAAECKSPKGGDYFSCIEFATTGYGKSTSSDYDPTLCNPVLDGAGNVIKKSECHPLRAALDAGEKLVDTLYEGYDRISLITFDSTAKTVFSLQTLVGGNRATVINEIRKTKLHDDSPYARMWPQWRNHLSLVNAANPEDRDGDGSDFDNSLPACTLDEDRWDDARGVPCDDDTKNDVFDWDKDGVYTDNDDVVARNWLTTTGKTSFSLVSTCTGCGMRAATEELKKHGRPGAVWVIVFLSDGAVNMSDTFYTLSDPDKIPASFPNGFCTKKYWGDFCTDKTTTTRYCIDYNKTIPANSNETCPPGAIWELRNPLTSNYSPFDYAMDMVDEAALTVVRNAANGSDPKYNAKEPIANDIAIYSVGLGPAISHGEVLLRYMAAVGDDGDRVTDQCKNAFGVSEAAKTSCGQYFYAATGDKLLPIFDNIASRIYTKITR